MQIEVKSKSWLVARVSRGGIALPEQNLAVSDGKLKKGSIDWFARALAQLVSAAS